MKILVVSDNHGDRQIVCDLMTHYDGEVDGFFHCGDSEFDSNDPLISRMHIVTGNMDHAALAEDEISKIDGKTILLTHGHLHGVNSGLLTLELFAKSKEANIVLFGHTHQLGVTQDQGILFVNPGSISLPRGQYAYIGGTYAIISSKNNKLVVQYYDRKFNAVDELRFSF